MSNTKTCTVCKETKPLSMFQPEKSCKTGYRKQCKACIAERLRQDYKNRLSDTQKIIIKLLNAYKGVKQYIISEYVPEKLERNLKILLSKKLILQDNEGFWSLTDSGKNAIKPRNPVYQKLHC